MKTELNGKTYTVSVEQGGKRLVLDEVQVKDGGDGDWLPEVGRAYFKVDGYGVAVGVIWHDDTLDRASKAFHNIWPTKDIAKKAAEYMRRSNAVIRACLLVDPDFVPQWDGMGNFCPLYSSKSSQWMAYACSDIRESPAYVSTREKAEQVCALLTKWGVK